MTEVYKAKYNPYQIIHEFEQEVARYTGAKYAVAVDSCTNALFLCCLYKKVYKVTIPHKTYLSVPQSILRAGGEVVFEKIGWSGIYELWPYGIYDAAKRFTSDMYIPGTMMCLSFHNKKILNIGKGGMILFDDKIAYRKGWNRKGWKYRDEENVYEWFKRKRYEGRGQSLYHEDDITEPGYNMYMTPEQAARGLVLMSNIPLHNEDQEEQHGYKDLTEFSLFKDCTVINRQISA